MFFSIVHTWFNIGNPENEDDDVGGKGRDLPTKFGLIWIRPLLVHSAAPLLSGSDTFLLLFKKFGLM